MRLKPPLIGAKHVSPQAQKKVRDGTLAILGVVDNNTVQGCVHKVGSNPRTICIIILKTGGSRFLAWGWTLSLAVIARVGGSVGATASFGETAGTQRHTCWKGQECELHPDDLLKQKQTGLFSEDWQKRLALGQELWLWWGLEHTRQWGLARPEKVTVQSSSSTWSQLMHKSFAAWRGNCSSYARNAVPWNSEAAVLIIC